MTHANRMLPELTVEARTPAEMRSKIVALEAAMKAMPQLDVPISHRFAPGLYLREMRLPQGAVITGKIHKTEHYCILTEGEVSLVTENGREVLKAGQVIHSKPGAKRAIHALTDCCWINIHHNPTNEKDESKIDDLFVVDTFQEFLEFENEQKLLTDRGEK